MTTVQIYRNRRNPNKYLEIHNDGYYHNSVRQYMYWEKTFSQENYYSIRSKILWEIKNFTVGEKQT